MGNQDPPYDLPKWAKILKKAVKEAEEKPRKLNRPPKKIKGEQNSAYLDLNDLALKKLKTCKSRNDIIPLKEVWSKLCTNFSITKKDCWKFLKWQQDLKNLEIITCHGIKLKY
jgi:hypothetical protein